MSNSATPWTVAHQAPLSMELSSKNAGVYCHSFLQGIFLTQISLPSELQGKPIVNNIVLFQILYIWKLLSLQMVTAAMKLKDAYSLEGKLWPT